MSTALRRTGLCLLALIVVGIGIASTHVQGSNFPEPPNYQPNESPLYQRDNEPPAYKAENEPPAYLSDSSVIDFLNSAFSEVPTMVGPMHADCGCGQGKPCTCKPEDCTCPNCLAVGCGKGAARRAARRQGGGGDDGGDQVQQMEYVPVASAMGTVGEYTYPYTTAPGYTGAYFDPNVASSPETYTDVNNNTWQKVCYGPGRCSWVQVATATTAQAPVLMKAGDKCSCCGMVMTQEQADKMNSSKTAAPKTATVPLLANPPMYQPQARMYYPPAVGASFSTFRAGAGSACSGGNCGGSSSRGFGFFRR